MKLPYLAPALLLHALLAPFALAQTYIPNPATGVATGNLSTVKISLTINETIGGWKITDAKKAADAPKLITYPDTVRFDAVYFNSTEINSLINPFGWSTPGVNNYVERVTSTPGNTLVTAEGWTVINKTRYTNSTLLAELLAAGEITTVKGYRIVAVRFDTQTDGEDVFDNTAEGYATLVKKGLYFFAEKGADDPAPIYLGAEDNVYDFPQLIDFSSFETVEGGKYKDIFTGTPDGFAYTLSSDSFSGLSLAEFAIYRRPVTTTNYHELRAGGVFKWKETYDNKAERNTYNRGAVSGTGLTGPATLYSSVGAALTDNSGIVTGSVTLPSAKYQANLNKYLFQIPRLATQ